MDFNSHVEQALAIANRQAPEQPKESPNKEPLAWRLAVIAGKVFAVSACVTGLVGMFGLAVGWL